MATLTDALAVVELLNSLKNRRPAVRRQAVQALGRHKLEASLALRHFSRGLTDAEPQVRIASLKALEQVGPAAVPALARALGDSDCHVRREATWALGQLGPEAQPAVPALVNALRDSDSKVRQGAIRSLGLVGRGAGRAVPALAALLTDMNLLICRLAACSLGQIGAEATGALVQALQYADLYVRCEAAWALSRMGPQAAPAVPALVAVLCSEAACCLLKADGPGESDPTLPTTAPVFIPPRQGTHEALCLLAIKALGHIGPDAQEAVPDLIRLLQHGNGTAQVAAAQALEQVRS